MADECTGCTGLVKLVGCPVHNTGEPFQTLYNLEAPPEKEEEFREEFEAMYPGIGKVFEDFIDGGKKDEAE